MSGFIMARRAGGADVPAMYRVYNTNLDEYFAPESIEFFMLQWPRGQFVAEAITGGVAGALSSYIMEDGAATITLLAVDTAFRGLGAGTALMDAFLPEAVAAGAPRIQLEARETNLPAIEFYERRGFRITERLPGLYTDGGAGVRMVLDLSRASAASIRPPPLRSRSLSRWRC